MKENYNLSDDIKMKEEKLRSLIQLNESLKQDENLNQTKTKAQFDVMSRLSLIKWDLHAPEDQVKGCILLLYSI